MMIIVKTGYADLFQKANGKLKRIRGGTKAFAYCWQQLEALGACTQEVAPGIMTIKDGTYTIENQGGN